MVENSHRGHHGRPLPLPRMAYWALGRCRSLEMSGVWRIVLVLCAQCGPAVSDVGPDCSVLATSAEMTTSPSRGNRTQGKHREVFMSMRQ